MICSKCKKDKPITDFEITKNRYIRNRCIDCRKKPYIEPVFTELVLKMRTKDKESIRAKAVVSGLSTANYVVMLHRRNMTKQHVTD
jgi:hypothetical protein